MTEAKASSRDPHQEPEDPMRRTGAAALTSPLKRTPGQGRARGLLEGASLPCWVLVGDLLGAASAYLLLHASLALTVAGHFALLSLVTFLLFGLDRWLAAGGRRRVSEANLLLLSALGGALGGLGGIAAWRHKRQRMRFRVLLPTFLFLHVALMLLVLVK